MPPIEGRLIQTWMYERSHPDDNHYSHPIDFVPLVDLNLKKVNPLFIHPLFPDRLSYPVADGVHFCMTFAPFLCRLCIRLVCSEEKYGGYKV